MKPKFFATPEAWRTWLERHHEQETELLVGFYKRDSGHPSITWPESVDQALCFGWIDGVRRNIDEVSYSIRFTPRKTTSTWSAVNLRRVEELRALGLMRPAGLAAHEARSDKRSRIYAYEQSAPAALPPEFERRFQAHADAWAFFQARSPAYQRNSLYWVMSAKKEETRLKRFDTLLSDSAEGRPLKHLTPLPRTPKAKP